MVAVVTSYKSPNPGMAEFIEFFSEGKEIDIQTTMQAIPIISRRG
ncbi:hypothetical protein [Nostoc sp.]